MIKSEFKLQFSSMTAHSHDHYALLLFPVNTRLGESRSGHYASLSKSFSS